MPLPCASFHFLFVVCSMMFNSSTTPLLVDTCSRMAFIPFVFTMPSHGIIYVSHHLSCGYSASELLLDRMGFCIWQRELFEVDDWCLPAVAVLWAGRERVMFSERHALVWFESIRAHGVASETHCRRESDDALSLRAQYPSSRVGYHVLQRSRSLFWTWESLFCILCFNTKDQTHFVLQIRTSLCSIKWWGLWCRNEIWWVDCGWCAQKCWLWPHEGKGRAHEY